LNTFIQAPQRNTSDAMGSNLLSIIIINYNGKSFLSECLTSIQEHVKCEYEVIVVDNASVDGSCEYLRVHFPQVRLIEGSINQGFSRGNNLGAKSAKGNLLLLLNNDTRLISSLTPAINEFDKDKQLGVLGCRMSYGDGTFQPSVGFEHTPLSIVLSWVGIGGFSFAPRIFKRVDDEKSHYAIPNEAAWVSGAFLMTRRDLWEQQGGLDDNFFMYVEEVDYCKRVRMAGYRVAYTPNVKIIHYEGGGRAWIGEDALVESMRSYVTFVKKYYGKFSLLIMRSGLTVVMLLRSFAYYCMMLLRISVLSREKARASIKAAKTLWKVDLFVVKQNRLAN